MSTLRNPRHERFAQGCALLLPPAIAYRQAGFSDKFPANAQKLLRKPKIKDRIQELRLRDEVDISYRRAVVRRELDCVAFCRLPGVFKNSKGKLLDLESLTDEEQAAISEVNVDDDGEGNVHVKVKAHPKLSAIELLMKLDGLSEPDKLEVSWDLTKLSDDELDQYERLARKAAIAGAV